jgi:hypothetical protein
MRIPVPGGLVRLALVAVLALLVLPAGANAGRLVVTGHDADDHCSGSTPEQCHYFKVATKYVRAKAPDPGNKVLLLECNGGVTNALDNAFGSGDVPRKSVCPSDAPGKFRRLALSTSKFSAIIVGSSCEDADSDGVGDNTLNLTDDEPNGCDDPGGSTPDSDLINKRKRDIKRFFNKGGGVFAMAGDQNGDGDPSSGPDTYYRFLPLTAEGVAVNPPFCLTNKGIELGFEDQSCPNASKHNGTRDDINCCETHNSFAEPKPGGALKVAERDSSDTAETLFADARIQGGGFVEDDEGPRIGVRGVPDDCVREDFTIEVRVRDASRVDRVRVLLDGREIRDTSKARFEVGIRASRLESGRHKIKVIATDAAGNRSSKTRRFQRCAGGVGGVGGSCRATVGGDSGAQPGTRARLNRRC